MLSLCMYMFYMQINGHPLERKECFKQGGILWHTMNQEIYCIKPLTNS